MVLVLSNQCNGMSKIKCKIGETWNIFYSDIRLNVGLDDLAYFKNSTEIVQWFLGV